MHAARRRCGARSLNARVSSDTEIPKSASDLDQHQLRRSLGRANHPGKPLGGDFALVGGGEVGCGEPLGKGKASVLEQHPRYEGRLERAA